MGIGTGVVLFVIGAVLALAINVDVGWADLDMIGYLLMGAGVVVFIISLILTMRRRSSMETVRHIDSSGERVTQRESRMDDVDPLA